MSEKALAVIGTEVFQSLNQGLAKILQGAGGGMAQMRLEFGKGHLDRVEIGAVRGQVEGRFRDAISTGEIPSDFPVAVRAIQVTNFARGLTMRAKLGTPRKTLLSDAEEAAELVLLPRRI